MTNKIAIIGGGISSIVSAYYLSSLEETEITLINGSNDIASCSANSTSINSLKNFNKGVSELGDILIDAFDEFIRFYQADKHKGIEKGIEYIIAKNDEVDFFRRFTKYKKVEEESYLAKLNISEDIFAKVTAYFFDFPQFYQSIINNKSIHTKNNTVTKMERYEDHFILNLNNGEDVKFDKVVLCTNSNMFKFYELQNKKIKEYINNFKRVDGAYLEAKFDLGYTENIKLSFKEYYFVYRVKDQIIQIGQNSLSKNTLNIINKDNFKKYHQYVESLNIKIPSYDKFDLKIGTRTKGVKRIPFWGELEKNLFCVTGLYKNGFSFSFLAASKIRDLILKSNLGDI